MDTYKWRNQVLGLLRTISFNRRNDFSGTGIIFYEDLVNLPHLQLSVVEDDSKITPIDSSDIATKLGSISTIHGPYHDGFHFIDIDDWQISHLSQYISPPIPQNAEKQFHGTGARLMSAMLASILPGIICVGLVSQEGSIHLFCSGNDIYREN
jgi:hypothetical protein